jgi:glucose/arabinose dehydrogenase
MLRVNVDTRQVEIFASGLRNPWRFSFDRAAGMLYIGDVGQGSWEEIDAVAVTRAGVNYGWNPKEGTHCYTQQTCATAGLTDPIVEYGHSDGCSVTGGYVYRGTALGTLRGTYFYSDYCSGWLRSFRYATDVVTEQKNWSLGTSLGNVLSFGEGADGELYICTASGKIYRIDPANPPAR